MRKGLMFIMMSFFCFHLCGQDIALTEPKTVRMVRPESGYRMFVKAYIEDAIDEWQLKEPGESNAHYKNRVTKVHKEQLVSIWEEEAKDKYLSEISKTFVLDLTIKGYDKKAEVMLLSESHFGRLDVDVPSDEKDDFVNSWSDIILKPDFYIANDTLGLARVAFNLPSGRVYNYVNKAVLDSMFMGVPYVLNPVFIVGERVRTGSDNGRFSDIDRDIPVGDTVNSKTWVLIISNENYRNESKVKFAKNDAESFRNYCLKTFCVPKRNIRFIQNATLKDFDATIKWMAGVAKQFGEDTKMIVYYVGHGISSSRTKKSYFVPVDGSFSKLKTCFSVDVFLNNLSALPVKSAVVFVDAGFNCYNRKGDLLIEDIDAGIRAKNQVLMGNVVACFASQGNETAFQYEDHHHGAFTYFLLNEIQNNPDDLKLGEIFYEMQSRVKTYSLSAYKKMQTPTVIFSAGLNSTWQEVELR